MPDITVQTAGTTTTTTAPEQRKSAAVRTRTPSLFRGILRCCFTTRSLSMRSSSCGGRRGRRRQGRCGGCLVFAWMQTGGPRGGGGGRGSLCIHITRPIVVMLLTTRATSRLLLTLLIIRSRDKFQNANKKYSTSSFTLYHWVCRKCIQGSW